MNENGNLNSAEFRFKRMSSHCCYGLVSTELFAIKGEDKSKFTYLNTVRLNMGSVKCACRQIENQILQSWMSVVNFFKQRSSA